MTSLGGAVGHLRARRLWLYGVGNGKSGTTSLAAMFDDYRSGHEVDRARAREVAARVYSGEIAPDSPEVRALLRRRRWRLHLEVDVAGNLSPFAGTAARMYPKARFVLLIRDCFSWLDSRIETTLRYRVPNDPFFRARFMLHDDPFAPEEAPLQAAGVLPLASYLRAWAATNDEVLDRVPAERLMVIRLEDLDSSLPALAAFTGVPADTLHRQHVNEAPSRTGLLAEIPRDFVIERVQEYCASHMERFWGAGWRALAERLPVRAQ
jgi:hypothetical protein